MAIAAIALVSCKKDELNTTELGTATINGNVWADMDLSLPGAEGVEGMQVAVIVNTADWDQQTVPGYSYDEKVYPAVTDANGDYSIEVPATDQGYNVTIEFEDLFTTRTNTAGTQENVKVTRADITKFIYSGAVIETEDQATVDVTNNNELSGGVATIKGTIMMDWDQSTWDGTVALDQYFNSAQTTNNAAQPLRWMYSGGNGPGGIQDLTVYSTTFDYTTGDYSIMVGCNSLTGAPVDVEIGILDFEGEMKGNNMAFTADSTWMGVWKTAAPGMTSVNDGQINLNVDFSLTFVPYF